MAILFPSALKPSDQSPVIQCSPHWNSAMEPSGEVTQLLQAWSAGNRSVEDRLFELVLPELRRLAWRLMRTERRDHTLQPSALLNEAYVRLLAARERDWNSRRHFYAVAARVMRRFLVDYARGRTKPQKCSIDALNESLCGKTDKLDLAIAVDRLLDELEATHPGWCSVVELKYFLGFSDQEASEVLGLPLRTLQRQFSDARRWLFERLNPS